jgi:hypothetical protein
MNDANKPETVLDDDDDMPAELDFSKLGKGERGKFYFPKEGHHIPFYLDQEVQAWLTAKAASKGVSPEEIANQLLKRDIEVIEAMK